VSPEIFERLILQHFRARPRQVMALVALVLAALAICPLLIVPVDAARTQLSQALC